MADEDMNQDLPGQEEGDPAPPSAVEPPPAKGGLDWLTILLVAVLLANLAPWAYLKIKGASAGLFGSSATPAVSQVVPNERRQRGEASSEQAPIVNGLGPDGRPVAPGASRSPGVSSGPVDSDQAPIVNGIGPDGKPVEAGASTSSAPPSTSRVSDQAPLVNGVGPDGRRVEGAESPPSQDSGAAEAGERNVDLSLGELTLRGGSEPGQDLISLVKREVKVTVAALTARNVDVGTVEAEIKEAENCQRNSDTPGENAHRVGALRAAGQLQRQSYAKEFEERAARASQADRLAAEALQKQAVRLSTGGELSAAEARFLEALKALGQ